VALEGFQAVADVLSEFGLIAKYFVPLATHPGALALTDDAAVLSEEAQHDLVVTADALTAGVHFLPDDPPNLIASKALRVNLSDLAAKGADPVGYLLALALPQSIDDAWLAEFARGLGEDQKTFGVSLLGGDTTATPGPLTIAITALGRVARGAMIRRSGAKPGDQVFVSGTIGDAGAGLAILQGKTGGGDTDREFLTGRYRQPTPRLSLGRALRGLASASLDVSDGLIADLGHISETSGVRIVVAADAIPLSAALARFDLDIVRAATAGDDYEIAFTASGPIPADLPVTRIGHVEPGQGVVLVDAQGHEIPVRRAGFTHF
jgi:thiamine-monophosphate kinase